MRFSRLLGAALLALTSFQIQAGGRYEPAIVQHEHYVAQLRLHTASELVDVLERADMAVGEQIGNFEPIAVVLHGDEARIFALGQYASNKHAIDLAARLDALRVVDIKICEMWMDEAGLTREDILPFVGFVPDGEETVSDLREAGYRFF